MFAGSDRARVGVDVMKVELRRNTTVSQFFSHMTRQFTEHVGTLNKLFFNNLNLLFS